jgi:hypothetical protein
MNAFVNAAIGRPVALPTLLKCQQSFQTALHVERLLSKRRCWHFNLLRFLYNEQAELYSIKCNDHHMEFWNEGSRMKEQAYLQAVIQRNVDKSVQCDAAAADFARTK